MSVVKKIMMIGIWVVLLFAVSRQEVYADGEFENVYEGFAYDSHGDGEWQIISYEGTATDITIPATIEGKPVVRVAGVTIVPMLMDMNLASVTVPEGVKYLNDYAFAGSPNLQKVYLPNSLELINYYTFSQFMLEPSVKEIIFAGTESRWEFLTQNVYVPDTIKVTCADSDAPVVYVTMNPADGIFTYDGKKHYPELILKHKDGSAVNGKNYKITYDSDCTSVGMQYVTLTFLGDYAIKNYSGTYTYQILPGKTSNVDVQGNDKEVKLSWKAVPGATHYRVCIYDDKLGYFKELEWDDGSIEAPYLTRTLTDLEPGKTYKMAIKAVWWSDDGQRAAPSLIQTEFTVKVPREGEVITTAKKDVETTATTTQRLTGPDTIVTEPADETTTVEEDTTTTGEETTADDETSKQTKEDETTEVSPADGEEDKGEKNNLIWYVLGIGAAVAVVAVSVAGGVIFVTIRKNKINS